MTDLEHVHERIRSGGGALRIGRDDEQLRLVSRQVEAIDGRSEDAAQGSPIQWQDVHGILAACDPGRFLRFSFHGLPCSGRVRCRRC